MLGQRTGRVNRPSGTPVSHLEYLAAEALIFHPHLVRS